MRIHTSPACALRLPQFALLLAAATCAQLTAQTVAPVLTPTTLSFTSAAGSSPPTQNLAVASSGASFNYSATAISNGNWLSVTPASGSTPGSLTVTANSTSLATGTYGGIIQISNGAISTAAIPVTLTVTGQNLSTLTAAPLSLVFDFASGSTSPQSRDLAISTTATASTTLTPTIVTSSPMLNVSVTPTVPSASATTPASVSVSVNPTGLAPGRYLALISFGAAGTTGTLASLIVTVGESAAGLVSATPSTLALAGAAGSTSAISQSLEIATSGSTPVSFTATTATTSCGSAWLSVNPISGTTPTTLSVQGNPSALPAGTCQGTITIQATGSSTPLIVPVTFTLSAGSGLTVPSAGPAFDYQIGGTLPAAQSVTIGSTGGTLSVSASVTGSPAFLSVTPTTATTPASLQLSLNQSALTGLTVGTYTNTVNVTSTGASNSPQSFPVTLRVGSGGAGSAALNASPNSAAFQFQVGQATPAAQIIDISSSGIPLRYTATAATTSCPGFFTASPLSGSTAEFNSQGQLQPARITITPVTAGLTTAITCTGKVDVMVEGASGSAPLSIPITMTVGTSNTLSATPVAIDAVAVAGSPTPNTRTISVASTTAGVPISFTTSISTTPQGQSWLSVTPATSQSPADLTVSLNQSGLLPGVYQGSIAITTTGTTPVQTIPVRFTVVGTMLTPAPATLSFTQSVGGAAPAAQTINLGVLPPGSTVSAVGTALNGSGWLTVTAPAGQGTVNVSVSSTGLTEGVYRGVVTITVPGTSPSPLNIPVSFIYGTPSAITASPAMLSFSYTTGASTTPASQTIQLTASGNATPYTATVASTTGGNFFSVTPTSGTTPGTLTVSLNQAVIATLAAGSYAGTVTVTSPGAAGSQTVAVNLTVTQGTGPATPAVTSIVNLATNQAGALAPGTIIGIFGTNLGPVTPVSLTVGSNGKVATALGNTTVSIDGVDAPLLMVSSGQINAIVPYEVSGKTSVNAIVRRTGGGSTSSSQASALTIAPTAPGVFTLGGEGTGAGAVLNQNLTINSATNAAVNGSIVVIFGTGEGLLLPAVETGSITGSTGSSFPQPVAAVTATVGGQAATVLYAGSAPGFIAGFLQVNLRLPSALPAGTHPVVLSAGGVASRAGVTVVTQ